MAVPWKTGAVVMLDALGFKGLWQHFSLDEVLARLHLIERTVNNLKKTSGITVAQRLGFEMNISFLSDTIVITCADGERPDAAVSIATAAAGYVMHAGATDNQEGQRWGGPLAYRGAISFGKFHIEERYIVGPAIDEAANAMGRPEGAFAYLTASAREHFRTYGSRPVGVEWSVPLKPLKAGLELEYFETWVATPFAHDAGTPGTSWEIAEEILKTFDRDESESVRDKKAHTETFLRRAHDVDQAYMTRKR